MRLAFVLSQVGQGLKRNLSMSIAVVIVTCVSLLFVGAATLTQMQISNLRDTWYGKIEISVSMCAKDDVDATAQAIEEAAAQQGFPAPTFVVARPGEGARRLH